MSPKILSCPSSKNWAAEQVERDAFFIIDADDAVAHTFVEHTAWTMEHGNFDVVGCDYEAIMPDGRREPSSANITDIADIQSKNPLPCCSLIRKSAFDSMSHGGWPENFTAFDDWGLWLKMWFNGAKMSRFPQTLFSYYRHKTNISNSFNLTAAKGEVDDLIAGYNAVRSRRSAAV